MKKVTIIKEKLPADLTVQSGEELIIVAYPNNDTTVTAETRMPILNGVTCTSIRGRAKFSTDGETWETEYTNNSGATQSVYIKTETLDGFTVSGTAGGIDTSVSGTIGKTSLLIDFKNFVNSKTVRVTAYAAQATLLANIIKGDLADGAGKTIPIRDWQIRWPVNFYGDITGVAIGGAGQQIQMNVSNMFGDLSSFISAGNRVVVLQVETTKDRIGQFTCSPCSVPSANTANGITIYPYLDELSLYNLVSAYTALTSVTALNLAVNGDESQRITTVALALVARGATVSINSVNVT